MKNLIALFFLIIFTFAVFAQKTVTKKPKSSKSTSAKTTATPKKKTISVKKSAPKPTPKPIDPAVEKLRFDEAIALVSFAEKASALNKFITDFPNSARKARAHESLVGARAALGDEKLAANETSEGVALFILAAEEAPSPIPERLFNEIVSKFPTNLYWRGQRASALEIAVMIEKKAEGNAGQLLALAAFYLAIENGGDAKRLAEDAIKIDPNSHAAYQTLGLAHRLNFDLEESANAYSKALELDGGSASAKRSLAEMKRALGKPDEAVALYREILAKDENDTQARTGLILSLFTSGKKADAESEMARSLAQDPGNFQLLAGAAYWHAAQGNAEKAAELAKKAIELEPRFIWSHIALARAFLNQKKPIDAEATLVAARQHGNFPTLDYEIASARYMAGFYREALEELQKSFTLEDGLIQTSLGGRISREGKNFTELIAPERRSSIFEPLAADNPENSAKLKLLLEMKQKLDDAATNESEIISLADEFVKGDDNMKLHRQLYAASVLLQKKAALPKVLELVKAAVGNTDAGLDVPSPAAAVMANELYESRTIAFSRNEILLVPEVPRQTLSAILRGRIEELTGWTLYQQKNFPDAVIRLRRAISVLPDKSAWWRSSMWRLGSALEADGKDKEALDSYIQSYKTDKPDIVKYIIVESLYKKVHGGTEGLEVQIGPNPMPAVVAENTIPASETAAKVEQPAEAKLENAAVPETNSEPKLSVAEIPKSELPAVQEIPKNEKPKEADTSETIAKTEIAPIVEPTPESAAVKTETNSETKPIVIEIPKSEPLAEKPKEDIAKSEPAPIAEATPAVKIDIPASIPEPETENASKTPLASEPPLAEAQKITSDTVKDDEPKPVATPNSLIDPVIIKIPDSSQKPADDESEKKDKTTVEEKKPETVTEENAPPKQAEDASVSSGAERPRIVDGQEIKPEVPPCTIYVSQENVSLLNNGGSLGVLAGFEGEGDLKSIAVSSNSPKDIEVRVEPEIAGVSNRAFFLIKSISEKTGIYQVLLEAPCGKKNILVKVR